MPLPGNALPPTVEGAPAGDGGGVPSLSRPLPGGRPASPSFTSSDLHPSRSMFTDDFVCHLQSAN